MYIQQIFCIYIYVFNQRGGFRLNSMKVKLGEWWKKLRRIPIKCVLLGAVIALAVALCISIYMRANIQKRYSNARSQIQEKTYQGMIAMTELFARVDDPSVDVRNKLIPSLKAEYAAVDALNTALIDGFGPSSAVLSAEQIAAFDAAFEEYASAYREGRATGLARDDMAACIADVQRMIDERYAPEAEATEPVLVIGATATPQS